jgi:tetratricopeptide (TPR) repeat protein
MHVSAAVAFALLLAGQAADVRQQFNAGRYQDVVRAAEGAGGDSRLQFLAAQSYTKLNDNDGARRVYARLAGSGDPTWSAIGRSGEQAVSNQLDAALDSANQAVGAGGAVPEAHFQRGLVLMARKDYGEAGSAFTKASQLDPNFAQAYYNAGLAYYRAKRIDLMTSNFEAFVKLAPDAPERPELESILRTVRGR